MKVWRNFLARERRTEHSQAVARVMISGLVSGYLLVDRVLDVTGSPLWPPSLLFACSFFSYSIAHYLWILRWPQPLIPRRGVAILADIGAISLLLHMLGEF